MRRTQLLGPGGQGRVSSEVHQLALHLLDALHVVSKLTPNIRFLCQQPVLERLERLVLKLDHRAPGATRREHSRDGAHCKLFAALKRGVPPSFAYTHWATACE